MTPREEDNRGSASPADRRRELCDLAVYNLEVGRQNLHDSQFSADAKLIRYYEGISLVMQHVTAPEPPFNEMRQDFEEASKLNEDIPDTAQKIVGLEALCNQATVEQRQALPDWKPDHALAISDASLELLKKAIAHYELVLAESKQLPPSDKQRVELTANLGLYTCKFASWFANRAYDDEISRETLRTQLLTDHSQLAATINGIRSSLPKPKTSDGRVDLTASLQIIRQITEFLDTTGKQLGPLSNK